jgi:hypothetical protein
MTISSLSSTGYYFGSANSASSQSGNPLQKALSSLENDLQSDDTTDASSVLSDLLAHGPKNATDSSATDGSSSNPADQLTKYLKTIQKAISSGDTSGAQTALASLQNYISANPPPTPPNGGSSGTDSDNPLQKALSSLASDLTSGDTTDASSVLSDIIAHTTNSGTSTSSMDSTSATTSSSDDFNAYLKSLSSAISSGDTSSAQSILTSFEKYLQANQPSSASGTYAANGDFTSTTSSGSSISALA